MKRSSALSSLVVVLQLITLALLILSFVTVPLFKFTTKNKSSTSNLLSLSEYNDIQYGVFGYCRVSENECSAASANYKAYKIQQTYSDDSSAWKMSLTARKSLSELLLVVPIAAGLVFVNFLINSVNLITQKRDVNENERFIFVQFIISCIFSFLSFAGAAMSCIVVFLLFYPHVRWPAWILIPAAILSLACLPLTFIQYLFKKNEIYNSESGATMNEKSTDMYGNNRLLSDDAVYEENMHSDNDYEDIDVTDDLKAKNFFTQLKKLGSENNNSLSDLERNSTAIPQDSNEYVKPSQLVDVMKNGSNVTLGTSSNNSGTIGQNPNKKDSYNLYQEYKQNEYELNNYSNKNTIPSKYDSAALEANTFREASGSSSHYTNGTLKQPGAIDRNNTFKTNDFKPESILFLDKKSPLDNLNGMRKNPNNVRSQGLKEVLENDVEAYSDISDSDKDFVRKNIIPKSERPILESDDGFLDDDQGSNFTSVSQRAGNPEYLNKRVNASNPIQNDKFSSQKQPIQVQQQYNNTQQLQNKPNYQGSFANQNNYQRQVPMQRNFQQQQRSGPMGGFAGQPPVHGNAQPFNPSYNSNINNTGMNYQPINHQQGQRAPMGFNNNSGFVSQTGPPYQQSQNAPMGSRFQPQVYKPGYKKRPMNQVPQMGATGFNNAYTGGSAEQPYTGFR